MPPCLVGVETQDAGQLGTPDRSERGAYVFVIVPSVPTLAERTDLFVDFPQDSRLARGPQVPAVLHLDELKDQPFSGRRRYENEIGAGSLLGGVRIRLQRRQQIQNVVNGNDEAVFERHPTCGIPRGPSAMRIGDRERDQFRRWRFVPGEANGQASTERLEVFQKKFRVSPAPAEPHSIQGNIEEIPYFFQVRGRGNQLQAAQVLAFRDAIDDVSVVHVLVVSRGVEILDPGVPVQRDDPVAQPVQLREAVRLFGRDLRSEHGRAVLGADVAGHGLLQDALQAHQPVGMPALRRVSFSVFRRWNNAAPHGCGDARVLPLEERKQAEGAKRSGCWRPLLFRSDARLERIERNGQVGRGLRVGRVLPRPAQSGHVHGARQAEGFEHPPIFGRQDAGAASTFLPRFRNESSGNAALLGRWIQFQGERRGRGRLFFRIPSKVFPRGPVVIFAGESVVDAAERSGDGQAIARAKRVNVDQPGSLVAVKVFDDLVPEHRGALSAHRRCGVRGLAFSEGAGQNRQCGLGLLVAIRHHADGVEAERIGEDERPAARVREKGREHGAVQAAEFIAHVLGGLVQTEGGMQHEIVVRRQPRHAQRMGGQHDQADRPTGKGLHFDRVAQRR